LIGDAVEDLRVAASLIAYGLATDDILSPHFPIGLIGTGHMGLGTVDLSGFLRGYTLAQGMAKNDLWNFGSWRSSGDEDDYRDSQSLVAIGSVAFLTVRGMKAPAEEGFVEELRLTAGDRERVLQLFDEDSVFYRTLRDAMHQSGRWPRSLQPNVEVLESWRSLAHVVTTVTWPT
jgi:hypothetical protein